MYSHGLASIALCEAYAMTHDKALHDPAQAAVNFICYAQDPVGGGWRYEPRQPGDTSVVGWQIMALKSGHMAYLMVPPITVKKAFGFLDTVQSQRRRQYGYTDPGGGDATRPSACSAACTWVGRRRIRRWRRACSSQPKRARQDQHVLQLLRHPGHAPLGRRLWKKWNAVMRDQLVNTQAKHGPRRREVGSSDGDARQDAAGGSTAPRMAAMILEVYYRHLPIYRKQSTEEEFPE